MGKGGNEQWGKVAMISEVGGRVGFWGLQWKSLDFGVAVWFSVFALHIFS